MSPDALKLLLVGLSITSLTPLHMLALQHRWWPFLVAYMAYLAWALFYALRITRRVMSFMDPDQALDQIQAMQRAREVYGDPPEPEFAAAIIRHAAATGLSAMFVRILDVASANEPNPDHRMVWILEVSTARGTLELRRPPGTSWREFLGTDPIAAGLGLLPADAP